MRIPILLILLFMAFTFTIVSCNQQPTDQPVETTNMISPDSLISQWNLNWNNHDSVALLSMFTDHSAVILSQKERLKGIDAINTGWLRESLAVLSNLKTENFSSSSGKEFAYYAGNYTLDRKRADSASEAGLGCFTMIWKVQPDNSWKIELLFFGEYGK
jgi:ketosteroid isomerase-like protein